MTGRPAGQVLLDDGTVFLHHLHIADTWWSRFRGLQFLPELRGGTGLLLHPCRSVHTCWMRFPIHLIFLGNDSRVVERAENVFPWSIVIPADSQVVATLEVPVTTHLPPTGTVLKRQADRQDWSPLLS